MNVVDTRTRSIPFSIPAMSGEELDKLKEVLRIGRFSGNGQFAKACQAWFEQVYGTPGALMTPSCTSWPYLQSFNSATPYPCSPRSANC